MLVINVVNKYTHAPNGYPDYYIGRGSPLGNPYTSKKLSSTKAVYQSESREESIKSYRSYLRCGFNDKSGLFDEIKSLMTSIVFSGGVNLVCFCEPKPCHGDEIKELVTELFTTLININKLKSRNQFQASNLINQKFKVSNESK